jgi:hypothetical protein
MYNQLPFPSVFWDFVSAHRVTIIHLVRLNVLRRQISLHYLKEDHWRSQVTRETALQLEAAGEWRQAPFECVLMVSSLVVCLYKRIDVVVMYVRDA